MDENGPFLARELSSRGVEPERISVISDRPEQLEAALRHLRERDAGARRASDMRLAQAILAL